MFKKTDRKSGAPIREQKEFDEHVIQIDRVTKVVKGGRRLRFRATVAIGNRKGKVGIGLGKSNEVTGAIQKAIAKAKKYLIKVTLDGPTIPHNVLVKFKSAKLLLMPAAPGTGLIAGETIRKVLELAGIKDILSKRFGSPNKVNNTKATIKALKQLKITPLMERRTKAKIQAQEQPKSKPPMQKPPVQPVKKSAPKKETVASETASAPKK